MDKITKISSPPRFVRWWSVNQGFWSNPKLWPFQPPDWIFLARAFDQIGSAMFGTYWTGSERVDSAGWDSDPGLIARRTAALQETAKRLQSKELIAGVRSPKGGEITEADPNWWNTEQDRIVSRLCWCQIDPKNPFGDALSGPNTFWIFIRRNSLEKFLDQQPFKPKPTVDVGHYLSPYLRVMLTVAREMKITRENQPKKADVEERIRSIVAAQFADELPNFKSGNLEHFLIDFTHSLRA
jgi:hypothetical protein